ncbi:MAG: sulfatase-like hydrolase/transferase, partial [Oscillospiraceae bacterium]|nr:sulfatase-like hydrolase/transferase [Oscillospiraceae bacterium]
LFENAFCQNPLCTPSRGSFLTGRYPVTTRLRQNGQDIPADEVLVTKTLSDDGYRCGLSGKLHLSACHRGYEVFGRDRADWPREYPTEEEFMWGQERRIDDGYCEFHWDHAPCHDHPQSSYRRWLLEKGVKFETPRRADHPQVFDGMPSEHHQTTYCVDKAIGFMESYKDSLFPWLFSVNMFDPHFPFTPVREYFERYLPMLDDLPEPAYADGEHDSKPPCHGRHMEGQAKSFNFLGSAPRDRKMLTAAYWAMIDHMDFQIGRLLEALERTGQKDRTAVIFTSDHGELLGDHGLYHKGPFLYDCAIKVPLIVSYGRAVPANVRRKALVELGDLAPTVLDIAGLPRNAGMQARSLWPFLTDGGAADSFREDVYCEYYNSNPDASPSYCTMVRDGRHKLTAFHGQNLGELYDLGKDPNEHVNLWNDKAYAGVKLAMYQRLCDRMAQTADPLPKRNGYY